LDEETQPLRNAIVIVIDRLGSGFLGPYGNTWVETPTMNQLASDSVLFENAFADSNDLTRSYRSLWSGVHAMIRNGRPECSLAKLIERAGFHATLLTDDTGLLQHPLAEDFGEQVALAQPMTSQIPTSIEETCFAQFTLAAIERLADSSEPGLHWLHAQGMNGPWDAPLYLAEPFRDEDDPEPYSGIVPPNFLLASDHDPDEVLSVMHAYAAQVSLIDMCIESLLDTIANHELADETLVIVTSLRGYPIGEHGRVGAGPHDLFGETLNVPLLIRPPNQPAGCMRLDALVQPTDLYATLAAWFDVSDDAPSTTGHDLLELTTDERAWSRQAVFATGDGERAVRTPAWMLHIGEEQTKSLYTKPDDRWEANEVGDRCGDVSEQLAGVMDEFAEQLEKEVPVELSPLADNLVQDIR
jgi:arylsulfatase A-like enzyme